MSRKSLHGRYTKMCRLDRWSRTIQLRSAGPVCTTCQPQPPTETGVGYISRQIELIECTGGSSRHREPNALSNILRTLREKLHAWFLGYQTGRSVLPLELIIPAR